MPLQWHNQIWQSLEEGAGKRCSECDTMLHCFQLQERLQQRREARKRAALDSRQEELRMESSPMPDSVPRSDSVSTMSSMVSDDDDDDDDDGGGNYNR